MSSVDTAPLARPESETAPEVLGKRPKRKSDRQLFWENLAIQIGLLVSLLVVWEYASDRWVPKLLISRPTDIWAMMKEWTVDGTYAKNLWVTVQATAAGFGFGAVGGLALGFMTGSWRRLGDVLQPIMMALYTLPRLALAPLFLLWFGLGMEFRIMFSATIVFFLVYYNTFFGVREVSQELIAAVRIMGANSLQLGTRVILPSALVWVTAGLKISVPYALVGVVVAEMVASNEGMGFLLSRAANQFSSAQSFAAIFALLIVAIVMDWALNLVTARALRWKTKGQT